MSPLEFCTRVRSGRQVYGTLIVSPSPRWPSAVAKLGIDFVFIDTEHISIDRHQLSWMCQAYRALGLPPVVRIPSPDPFAACMALDGGASGVIAPYVETVRQAQDLVGAVKLRPVKGERLSRHLVGEESFEPRLRDYLAQNNSENLLVLNIESVPALNNLESILKVPGVDAVLIGPHDLSCSLGIPEEYSAPIFLDAVRTIITTARRLGVGAGIHSWMGHEQEVEWARMGANFLIHEADLVTFVRAGTEDFKRLRASLGDAQKSPSTTEISI